MNGHFGSNAVCPRPAHRRLLTPAQTFWSSRGGQQLGLLLLGPEPSQGRQARATRARLWVRVGGPAISVPTVSNQCVASVRACDSCQLNVSLVCPISFRFVSGGRGGFPRGQKINANFFWEKVFREPFESWTSAPKTVDVRTKKCVFLQLW